MEKINRFLRRSKTFNTHDDKRKNRAATTKPNDTSSDITNDAHSDRCRKLAYDQQHLAKLPNPTDPQATLKRLEKENLRRPKIQQIIGLEKSHRNSFGSDDIIIRKSVASPKSIGQRTKTMFDFFTGSSSSKPKKSPLPPAKKPSTLTVPDNSGVLTQPNRTNRAAKMDGADMAAVFEMDAQSVCANTVAPTRDSASVLKKQALQAKKRAPEAKRRAPEAKNWLPEFKNRTFEDKNRAPEAKNQAHEAKNQTPEAKMRAPEPKMRAPEAKNGAPEAKNQAHEAKNQTPEAKIRTPEAKIRTPEAKNWLPEFKNRTFEAKNGAPEAEAKNQAHEAKNQTPEAKMRTPEAKIRAPEAKNWLPEFKNRTFEAKNRAPEAKNQTPEAKTRAPEAKMRAPGLMSSVEIDIDVDEDGRRERDRLPYMRYSSRSMCDVQVPMPGLCISTMGSVKLLKERFEEVPIMGRISVVNKTPANIASSLSAGSNNRRSSLPVDFKDSPPFVRDKRDKTMASQQPSQMCHGSPSNVNKNSQHNLVPKSPTKIGDSTEDNQNAQKTSTNRKSIKNILQKFLNRRPSQLELVTKGIIQDQRIFGNSLRNLCAGVPAGDRQVPELVSALLCMIQDPCNVISHGIYRASGNSATIQKIRFRVNEGKNLDVLQMYRRDVDVLTGSLKMFFRELTEPLISTQMYQDLVELKDRKLTDHDRLLSEADIIIKRQPDYHRDVLTELINHILYVNSFGDKNSMSIDSMSIVWGPSLIFTDNEDSGMLLQRITNNNSIVKFLLNIYNANYIPSKHVPPQRLYTCESTLSLASTSDKGSTSRPSLKQQHSVDDSLSIDDLELLIKSIQDSELAKKYNIYVMYKGKKYRKIIDRIKAKKSIEKYTTTKEGLCGIVETLKSFVLQAAVVPADFLKNYDGGTLSKKQIEAALDQLPPTNHHILTLVLNHLNDMQKINPEKYSPNLLVESWLKVLFMSHQTNANAPKYFEQLLGYYQSSRQFGIEHTAHQKQMMTDLSENLQLRARLSDCESFLDEDVLSNRISTDSGDVEIRKSQLYQHRDEQERRKNNRNS